MSEQRVRAAIRYGIVEEVGRTPAPSTAIPCGSYCNSTISRQVVGRQQPRIGAETADDLLQFALGGRHAETAGFGRHHTPAEEKFQILLLQPVETLQRHRKSRAEDILSSLAANQVETVFTQRKNRGSGIPGCGLQIGFGHVEAVGLQPGEIGSLSLVTLHPTGRSGQFPGGHVSLARHQRNGGIGDRIDGLIGKRRTQTEELLGIAGIRTADDLLATHRNIGRKNGFGRADHEFAVAHIGSQSGHILILGRSRHPCEKQRKHP